VKLPLLLHRDRDKHEQEKRELNERNRRVAMEMVQNLQGQLKRRFQSLYQCKQSQLKKHSEVEWMKKRNSLWIGRLLATPTSCYMIQMNSHRKRESHSTESWANHLWWFFYLSLSNARPELGCDPSEKENRGDGKPKRVVYTQWVGIGVLFPSSLSREAPWD